MPAKTKILKGVNLGGWLIIEKWMTPALFKGSKAMDEYSLCVELGQKKQSVIKRHRDTFITKKDFEWIAANGLNSVRLPVGYWLFGERKPYLKCEKYVDKAMEWAGLFGLKVIIDLHGAEGSQNGLDHSGKKGETSWHTNPENVAKTVGIVGEIAKKYGRDPSLYGIELLNEPSREIPLSALQNYYQLAYGEARKHCGRKVAIIISDAYRPIAEWDDFINSNKFSNVLLDIHLYQVFSEDDKKLNFKEHIAKTFKWGQTIQAFGPEKILIGEWSMVLDKTYQNMAEEIARNARLLYRQAQLFAFSKTAGNFYWNYKTENNDDWNYKFQSEQLELC